ncbi:zinc-ribbon domain-containing protein [uncultured Tateyamaria sp.]|uniref:zinc-ribbon domain-containing protein n=1 Tax=Tateyamaria sp. 1078 TaxID=3417464 RepID=UPI00261299A3|nr:zinc-ribbon domain-containing protein [uncultured Tateyamaria sp.]
MRLICPNCDAQYEVVDDVIPAEGRDVQCSNCGQTWFQHHPDHAPAEEAPADLPPDLADPEDDPVEDEERTDAVPPPPPAPAPDLDPEPEPAPPPPPAPEPQQRIIDPDVAGILREEAEREAQARAGAGIETQPDLGLDSAESEGDRRARQARERMARLRGETPPVDPVEATEAVATAAAVGSRRELLPDIEEINSTLRSSGEREQRMAEPSPDTAEQTPKRGGFRRGFLLMVFVAAFLAALYIFAPQIAQAVPQADPYLSAYVAQVDVARSWLDGQVQQLLLMLDAAAIQSE